MSPMYCNSVSFRLRVLISPPPKWAICGVPCGLAGGARVRECVQAVWVPGLWRIWAIYVTMNVVALGPQLHLCAITCRSRRRRPNGSLSPARGYRADPAGAFGKKEHPHGLCKRSRAEAAPFATCVREC